MKQKAPVQKNEYYNVVFEDLTHEGSRRRQSRRLPDFRAERAA
ncbi:hypothetical protein AAG663_18800 [Bacillus licheniformis]